MADEMTKVVKEFVKILNERDRKAVKPYDTPAKVVRVDGNTAWVHIPGGVDETPAARTTNAMPGDNVQVRISGGRAWLTGNATNPPTDDARANMAYSYAGVAQKTAVGAQDTADEAIGIATNAEADAKRAHDAADAAEFSAKQAKDDAKTANDAANQAINNLSVVQDVVGVMDWVSKHGKFVKTEDVVIQEGKVYFTYDGTDYTPVVNPKVEDIESYYELSLDEAMQTYIMSHLAVTGRGLWVLPSGTGTATDEQHAPGYKVLISAGSETQVAGMYLYDASGKLVSSYGSNGSRFASDKIFYFGSEDAYILFTPATSTAEASIILGGANIKMGTDEKLSEVIDRLSAGNEASIKNVAVDYIYASNPDDESTYSATNTSLEFRAISVSTSNENTQSTVLKWETNPEWASKRADNYITEVTDGITIRDNNSLDTYVQLDPYALSFFASSAEQAKIGNIPDEHIYGVIAESINAYGSGSGVKFDNAKKASNDEVRGRFIWLVRDNGHLSLKRY